MLFFHAHMLRAKALQYREFSIIQPLLSSVCNRAERGKKWESSWNQPEMKIEVTRNRSWKTDIKKVRKAIKEVRSLKKVYVFNIEETACWRISKPEFDEEDGNCFSGVLKFNFKNSLRE